MLASYSVFLGLLAVISFIVLYMTLERILYFMTLRHLPKISVEHLQRYMTDGKLPAECPRIKSSALMDVVKLMSAHGQASELQKKEATENWLQGHKAALFHRLKWIGFWGQGAFWLGFMGFVVTGYDAMLVLSSAAPHLWVPSLYKALSLLALGTSIFVPSLLIAKALKLWGGFYMGRLKNALSLMMSSGVVFPTGCPVKHS